MACNCSLHGPGQDAVASDGGAAESRDLESWKWVLVSSPSCTPLSLMKNCFRHMRCPRPSSSPADTLISNTVFGSQAAASLEEPGVSKVFRCRKEGPFAFRGETSLFFLCESQSEGPQGADFQVPSNSYTSTLALTPATQGSELLVL